MNAKQAAPLLAALPALELIAPPLLIGAAIGLGLVWLFSEDEKKEPEATPANTPDENQRKPAEIAAKTPVFRQIPAQIPIKPAATPVVSVPRLTVPPPPIKRKVVSREDMAAVFQNGASKLTRTAAVAALKRLGFGKTAAYAALTQGGRFATWLQCASDGIITWKDGHTA